MAPADNSKNTDPVLARLNPVSETRTARPSTVLGNCLSVYRADWHGIRSASAALPGHKLLLDEAPLASTEIDRLAGAISALGVATVCFQGYSPAADVLARAFKDHFGSGIRLFAVSHVTSTQFQAPFEVRMQAALLKALADGVFVRLGSVKPGFHDVVPATWPQTLINYCPDLGPMAAPVATGAVFVPVENHWRKGLYTNLIAALRVPAVRQIFTVNAPTNLELIEDLSRLCVTGFLDRAALQALLARVDMVLNVSLAECQPMTQLEAFALGRPCLTGPLGLADFTRDEIINLCTVGLVDTPSEARGKLGALMDLWARDATAVQGMIADHMARRHALAEQRYADFFAL
ncbi:MAG: hypothetical protein EP335_05100 [Alphaproteobacteria bacterium]|nr:MAG: hypothetical protein EP335_05100 [Alphaproteobacteria bacterium]